MEHSKVLISAAAHLTSRSTAFARTSFESHPSRNRLMQCAMGRNLRVGFGGNDVRGLACELRISDTITCLVLPLELTPSLEC